MRLTDSGAEMSDEEFAEFWAERRARLCAAAQHWLATAPDPDAVVELIFPHIRGCRSCAISVSEYFEGKSDKGVT